MASPKQIFSSYLSNKKSRHNVAKIYFRRLLKATLLIALVPTLAISSLVFSEKLSLNEGLIYTAALFFGSILFARPYLADLSALTNYVKDLARDKTSKTPPLSFLGIVEELSQEVVHLHHSWESRKIKLEAAIAESTILFNVLPDVLLMLDEDFKVLRANKAAVKIFGAKILKNKVNKSVDNAEFLELLKDSLSHNKSQVLEFQLSNHKVHKEFMVNIEPFPLKSSDGTALVVVMHDVTEARRTRQLIKDFIGNASHEIRTPLTSLAGFIETMQTVADKDPEARKKFLNIMAEQTDHMSSLVNDLLSLSKIEMQEGTLPTEVINIKEVIDKSVKRSKWLADEHDMKIKIAKKFDFPSIVGDKDELGQVFLNLISNAVRYGNKNSTIIIDFGIEDSIPMDAKELKRHKKALYVSVTNEGEGIAPEDIPRITERFYRVDKVRSRKLGGAGLGLSIVKHILNRHHAHMEVISEPGVITTFTIYFPITESLG